MQQALDRAVENGVKNLVVQPTHLMHGAEYDEMTEAINGYKDKFESVAIAEPMLGEVGDDATVINDDKKAVAQAITDEACKEAGFELRLAQHSYSWDMEHLIQLTLHTIRCRHRWKTLDSRTHSSVL